MERPTRWTPRLRNGCIAHARNSGSRAVGGFTLIEVLIAMMILAVGLLGLEALAIGAARSVASAQHRTMLAAAATQEIEDRMQAIRSNPAGIGDGVSCREEEAVKIRICTTIASPSGVPGLRRVTVQVQRLVGQPLPYSVSSYVFHG
jgi:prepilin-type N-terminal cleavage/methylation domain-containing protein